MAGLPHSVLEELRQALEGTWQSASTPLESIAPAYAAEYQEDDLEDALLGVNLEQCSGCGWWMDSDELLPIESDDEDDDIGYCDTCRKERP